MKAFGMALMLIGGMLCLWAVARFIFFAKVVNFWPPLPQYESTTIGLAIMGAAILFLGVMHWTERM